MRSRSASRSPEQVLPEAVQDLMVIQTTGSEEHPSVALTWTPPANCSRPRDISHYCIRVSSKLSEDVLRQKEVKAEVREVEFSGDDSLEPLQEYVFAVQAIGHYHAMGEWNEVDGFVGRQSLAQ